MSVEQLYLAQYYFIKKCNILLFSDERDAVQRKTFTKWVNKHLSKVSSEEITCNFATTLCFEPAWSKGA
jgi:hypothetical protein